MPTFMGLTNGFEIRQSDSLTAGVADDFILFVARSSYQFSSEFWNESVMNIVQKLLGPVQYIFQADTVKS